MTKPVDLAYWINERETIRMQRAKGMRPPWSADLNMTTVRYCNVRREEDKVTKWIAENWRNPNVADPNLTLAMVMARMINWPDTLEKIGYPTQGGSNLGVKQAIMESIHGKKWTSAYTISTCGRSMGKEEYVFGHVLRQVAERNWDFVTKIRTEGHVLYFVYSQLKMIDGLGSFLAAQVVADLKNTPGHPLADATDWWDWSAPGPGSLRGLAAYYGAPVRPSNYRTAIRQCFEEVIPFLEPHIGRLHMQDFQNCLCEFSKYMRVKEGDGRVRNTYTAR